MTQGNSGRKNWTRAKGYSLEELWNNQVGPNFWERFKNKELGSQKMDQIINSIKDDWNALDGPNSTIHEQNFKKGLEIFGSSFVDAYQDKRSIDNWKEAINPLDLFTALGLRTIELGGVALDKTVGNSVRYVSSLLGLDPRWGEVASTGTQILVGPAALKMLPKGFNAASKLAGSQRSLTFASKANQFLKKGLSGIKESTYNLRGVPPSKQTITLNKYSTILDDAANTSMTDIRRISNIAKKNNISLSQAKDVLDLENFGIKPAGTINPGSTRRIKGIKNKGLLKDTDVDDPTVYIPPEERPDSTFFSMSQGDFNIPMVRSAKAISNIQKGVGILKYLDGKQKAKAIEIVKNLEQFHIAGLEGKIEGWKSGRPTTRYGGERIIPYTRKDGTKSRMYWNWSGSNKTYKATDLEKLIETRLRRKNWNTNSPGLKGQSDAIYNSAKERNAAIKESIKQLETTNPQLYREILGGDQTWYVEHIHAQKSPFWNKPRPFKPRDPANIVAIGDDIFPKTKTAIEAILYSDKSPYKGKIYLDYDRKTQNLILKDAETDLQIGSAIPGITNTRDARDAFLRALQGGGPLTLAEINPDLRKFVDYQDKISESIAKQKPDVDKSGARPKETDRFDEYRLERERILVQIEAHNSGLKVLNTQYLQRLKRRLFALNKIIDQGRLFDTKPGQGFLKNLLDDIFPDD